MKPKLCSLIEIPKFSDGRGDLSFVENGLNLPFEINRIYYLYNVPPGETRGAHGHKNLQQLIMALAGSFEITITDGVNSESYLLDRPNIGLLIPRMVWRDLHNFSKDCVCLVVASEKYDEGDYYRSYSEFIGAKNDQIS